MTTHRARLCGTRSRARVRAPAPPCGRLPAVRRSPAPRLNVHTSVLRDLTQVLKRFLLECCPAYTSRFCREQPGRGSVSISVFK